MRILFLGDVVGLPGRSALSQDLARLRQELQIDFVFANGENASGGYGLTAKHAKALFRSGLDGITGGNHIWQQRDLYNTLEKDGRVLRPHNYRASLPGSGVGVFTQKGLPPVAVINVIGRTFMPPIDCPFASIESVVAELTGEVPIILVDFHAEATGEKKAMGYFLDGKVTAVVGTHTHVQTNDAQILPKGTAYLTDLGMCGASQSCLGMKTDILLERYLTGLPCQLEVATGRGVLQGAIFDIDEDSGRVLSIATYQQDPGPLEAAMNASENKA